MFSGLSNYFKRILPKRLFYRALLIVAVPILGSSIGHNDCFF